MSGQQQEALRPRSCFLTQNTNVQFCNPVTYNSGFIYTAPPHNNSHLWVYTVGKDPTITQTQYKRYFLSKSHRGPEEKAVRHHVGESHLTLVFQGQGQGSELSQSVRMLKEAKSHWTGHRHTAAGSVTVAVTRSHDQQTETRELSTCLVSPFLCTCPLTRTHSHFKLLFNPLLVFSKPPGEQHRLLSLFREYSDYRFALLFAINVNSS